MSDLDLRLPLWTIVDADGYFVCMETTKGKSGLFFSNTESADEFISLMQPTFRIAVERFDYSTWESVHDALQALRNQKASYVIFDHDPRRPIRQVLSLEVFAGIVRRHSN